MLPDKQENTYYTGNQRVTDHLSQKEGESWAVSYADVLMVLLSFFVIFFKIDDKSLSVIVDIKKSFEKKKAEKAADGLGGIGSAVGGVFTGGKRGLEGGVVKVGNTVYRFLKLEDLSSQIEQELIKITDDPNYQKSLQIDFSPDIFKKNSFELTEIGIKDLYSLMESLRPHYHKIQLDITGHTDSRPILNRTEAVQNNFDLSVLRASKTLSHFLKDGAYADAARAMGVSHHTKSSRTVTIKIKPVSLIVERERPPLPKHLKAKYEKRKTKK
jgi:chemotaxis protein MotB